MEVVCARVKHMLPDTVANMDQTPIPIPLAFNANKTLDWKGNRTVHILAPGDKDRATLNASITMGGNTIKPMVFFKGTADSKIAKKELIKHSLKSVFGLLNPRRGVMSSVC
jgi:hypothetical protein